MSQHSTVVGSSSAERVINCPGSVPLSAGVPDTGSSSYADEGTMLHNAMEAILNGKFEDPEDAIGVIEYQGHVLTDSLYIEMIEPALEQFDEICADLGGVDFETERRVDFGKFIPGAFGTADIVGKGRVLSLVADWKFGRGVEVEAENNYQCMFSASAARKMPDLQDLFTDAPIRCVIIQPAFGDAKIWDVTHDELDVFDLTLKRAVEKSRRDDAPLETGKWCKFCAAKPICPLKQELAAYAVEQDIERELTADELGELTALAFEVEEWAKATLSLAHGLLDQGELVTGYKTVDKRSSGRKVIDEKKLLGRLRRMKAKIDEYMPRKLGGVGVVEKVVKQHLKDKEAVARFMAENYEMAPSSGTTLVEESDKRPAALSGTAAITALSKKLAG